MTAYELAVLADRVTGILAAVLSCGLLFGYGRVLAARSPLIRDMATSTTLLVLVGTVEALRVRENDDAWLYIICILFNLTLAYALFRGLSALYRMIPEQDRPIWRWWSAPLYPPWGWFTGMEWFVHRWHKHWQGRDRRKEDKPIDFPDRREK